MGALALALLAAGLLALAGCQAGRYGAFRDDPALTALGEASVKVMGERLIDPLGGGPGEGEAGASLRRPYALGGTFEGTASEAVMGLAQALGYGFSVKNAQAGRLRVTIAPSDRPRPIFWLIGDLNRQLGEGRAYIGIDAVNKRLILSAPEGER
jgi:hypothetical protein